MRYEIDKRPTIHTFYMSKLDVIEAIQEWADNYSKVEIPEKARLYTSYNDRTNEVTARISWDEDEN